MDSGANIGQFILYLGQITGVNIIAFEPLSEAADRLEECLYYYPSWNVRVMRLGLSDSNRTLPLQVDGARSTARLDWYKKRDLKLIDIPVEKLDDALFKLGIQRVRLWKLDVEGHELNALKGAQGLLCEKGIDAILIETSDKKVEGFLKEVGYGLHKISDGKLLQQKIGASGGNYVALPIKN